MLSYRLLKNHAGILLIGDYTSLRWLHEVVHDVNERSPLVREKEGMFLSLAYDVRKAYERQREIILPPPHYDEMGVRYGVQILWPVQREGPWPRGADDAGDRQGLGEFARRYRFGDPGYVAPPPGRRHRRQRAFGAPTA